MNKIAAAFVAAKKEFAPALKSSTNPHFRSKYADLAGCLEAVNDALLNNGIAVYQETSADLDGVTVETVFMHESGEVLRGGKLHVPAAKQDPQGYGSALTYARRYSIMAACGIAAEDDDGNAASKAKPRNALDNVQPAVQGLPLMLPNNRTYAVLKDSGQWVNELVGLCTKVKESGKLSQEDKILKLSDIGKANEKQISKLDFELQTHVSLALTTEPKEA
jgi:hypothetical protein